MDIDEPPAPFEVNFPHPPTGLQITVRFDQNGITVTDEDWQRFEWPAVTSMNETERGVEIALRAHRRFVIPAPALPTDPATCVTWLESIRAHSRDAVPDSEHRSSPNVEYKLGAGTPGFSPVIAIPRAPHP